MMYVLLKTLVCFLFCTTAFVFTVDPPIEKANKKDTPEKTNAAGTGSENDTPEESSKATIRLGGPRKVTVEIIKSDSSYRITATFLPVKSFDKAMNTSLSRDKGDAFVREALFKHLGGMNGQSITISQLKKLKSDYTENLFTYMVELPVNSLKIQQLKKETNPVKTQKSTAVPKSILNAKADQLATLDFILVANEGEYPKYKEDLEDFYKKVAESETTIIQRLEAFANGVKADKWLLSIERDELIQKANAEMSRTIDCLQTLIEKAALKAAKEQGKPSP
jgi:hypothetical protein